MREEKEEFGRERKRERCAWTRSWRTAGRSFPLLFPSLSILPPFIPPWPILEDIQVLSPIVFRCRSLTCMKTDDDDDDGIVGDVVTSASICELLTIFTHFEIVFTV